MNELSELSSAKVIKFILKKYTQTTTGNNEMGIEIVYRICTLYLVRRHLLH